MTTVQADCTAEDLWAVLKKEITGIQSLWETVERLFSKPSQKGLDRMADDIPLVFCMIQTALMEAILMRISRLMDPANSGRKEGDKPNLSLKRLVALAPEISGEERRIRRLWDDSNLKILRDKYLSHNDLTRSLGELHTLNIPLEPADIEVMRALARGVCDFRESVHRKLTDGVAYLGEPASTQIQRDIDILNRSLVAGQLFFQLLPHHEALGRAWHEESHG